MNVKTNLPNEVRDNIMDHFIDWAIDLTNVYRVLGMLMDLELTDDQLHELCFSIDDIKEVREMRKNGVEVNF